MNGNLEDLNLKYKTKRSLLFYSLLFFFGVFFSLQFTNLKFIETIGSLLKIKLNKEFWNYGLQHFGIELMVLSGILMLNFFVSNAHKFLFYIVVIVLIFFVFLFQNAVNIPITDDCFAILDFSNKYFFTDSAAEKFALFTSFYDENRIISLRCPIILLHYFTGEVNIKTLILIFNLFLPIILFLFYKSTPSGKFRMEIILIIAILLFHFGYYDSILWIFAAFDYKFVVLCLMASLFLIRKRSIFLQVVAGISIIICALTVGNGMLVFPIVILYFFIEKKWNLLFFWIIIATIIALFYFNNFISSSSILKQGGIFHPIIDYFIFSCCFLGSAFQFFYKLHLPFIFGLIIWILFVILTFKKYYTINYIIYGLILFVMLSSLMAAQFRMNGGLPTSISNRYGFYSLITFSALIIAFFEIINVQKRNIYLSILLFFSIGYHLLTGIFFYPEVPIRKAKLENFISDIKANREFHPMPPVIPRGAEKIVKEAMYKGIYFP